VCAKGGGDVEERRVKMGMLDETILMMIRVLGRAIFCLMSIA